LTKGQGLRAKEVGRDFNVQVDCLTQSYLLDQVGKVSCGKTKGLHLGFSGTLIEVVKHTLVSDKQDCWVNA
jgi:hypothetical protein